MTAAERQELREAVDQRVREVVTADKARRMVSWFTCPTHGLKVGVDRDGHLLGRCSGCAEEAAENQLLFEAGYL